MSVNKAMILGNLGKDPELRCTQSGTAVTNFSVATSRKRKSRDGEQTEETEWHRLTAWGKTAELICNYLGKGSTAFFEGRLATRSYDKDGVTHYVTEIVVDQVTFVGGKGQRGGGQQGGYGGGGGGGGYGQQGGGYQGGGQRQQGGQRQGGGYQGGGQRQQGGGQNYGRQGGGQDEFTNYYEQGADSDLPF